MTTLGDRIIAWAVQRCQEEGLDATDANILLFIHEYDGEAECHES